MEERIIGRYDGDGPGPLLICIGSIHGNEPAGTQAIIEVLRLLDIERDHNPGFKYFGTFVGLRGNLAAIEQHRRFIRRDLNRMILPEEIARIQSTPKAEWTEEDKECIELVTAIEKEIERYQPSLTLIIDFHTTTAGGGLFTIASGDPMSTTLAKGLHAPVILGFDVMLNGTTVRYFNKPELNQYCIVFEGGQHEDPDSVYHSAAAIVNCMRAIGSVDSRDVDHRHDGMLIKVSEGLPQVTRLIFHYRIRHDEDFRMKAGYKNFQPIQKGEILASNEKGVIISPLDGLILMPKYQSLGDDGFFIVEVVE